MAPGSREIGGEAGGASAGVGIGVVDGGLSEGFSGFIFLLFLSCFFCGGLTVGFYCSKRGFTPILQNLKGFWSFGVELQNLVLE